VANEQYARGTWTRSGQGLRCLAGLPPEAVGLLKGAHGNDRTGLSETGLAERHPKGPSDPACSAALGGGEAGWVGPGGGLGACEGPRRGLFRAAQLSVAGCRFFGGFRDGRVKNGKERWVAVDAIGSKWGVGDPYIRRPKAAQVLEKSLGAWAPAEKAQKQGLMRTPRQKAKQRRRSKTYSKALRRPQDAQTAAR
jgi:hypothetical protein